MVSTIFIGRAPGSFVDGAGLIGEDDLRVCVFNRTSEHLWLRRLGARLNESVAPGDYRLVAYRGNAAHEPDDRLGYVGLHNATATESDVEWDLDVIDIGPSVKGAMIQSNSYVGIGIECDTGTIAHRMITAASLTGADEERFFNKSAVAVPPDPFGSYSASIEGHLAAWGVCDTNDPPTPPVNRTTNTATGDLTPTLEADFRDRNGAFGPGNGGVDVGDVVLRANYHVRRVSDQVSFWDHTYLATGTEQTNNRTTRQYAGTTLVRGTAYEWNVRHQDQFGAWGSFTSTWVSYTPPSAGTVTLAGTPTGKQETVQPGPIQFDWVHATALATNAAEIRLKVGGQIDRTSGTITKSVASGAVGSITWVETGFADLDWGAAYTYEVRGRDTNNVFSAWSAGRDFSTNAAPTVPSGLTPTNDAMLTSRPLLSVSLSDPDDDSLTGLIGKARIRSTPVLNNPSFAVDTSSWVADGVTAGITQVLSRDTVTFDSSPAAGKIAITANTAGIGASVNYRHDQFIAIEAGESHTQHLAVRTSNVNITPRQYVRWYDTGQVLLSTDVEADWTPTANAWTTRNFAVTAPASAKYMKHGLQAFCDTAGPIGDVWFDTLFAGSSIRRIRTLAFNATTGKYEYQTVAEDLPDVDRYEWNAYSFDGTLYSGAVTVEANATRSTAAVFHFVTGPTVTITSPADPSTITTTTPTVQWSPSAQVKWRLRVYDDGGSVAIYDTGWVVEAATRSHQVPAGRMANGANYDIVVSVEDSSALQGDSLITNVLVQYTAPPEVTGLNAAAYSVAEDPWPTAIRLEWEQTTEPAGTFVAYHLYRDDIPNQPYLVLASAGTEAVVDYTPVSGVLYGYTLTVVALRDNGIATVESVGATTQAAVTLKGVVLSSVVNPGGIRAVLTRVAERRHQRRGEERVYLPWGAITTLEGAPTTVRGKTRYWETIGRYLLADDAAATAARRREQIELVDESNDTLCYRDERGHKRFVVIPTEGGLSIEDRRLGRSLAELTLRDQQYTEVDGGT